MNRHPISPANWPTALPTGHADSAARVDGPPVATLGDMMAVVARRWRPLTAWLAVCLCAAVWYLQVTPPEFTASATVILEPRRQTLTTIEGTSASYSPTLDSAQAESQIQIIRSERILSSVFDILNLQDAPEFIDHGPGLREQIAAALGLAGRFDAVEGVPGADPALVARMKAFQAFSERVAVRRVGQSYVLDVSYRAGTAAQAARIANAVTAAYILAQIDQKVAAAQNGAEYLQNRITYIIAEHQAALDGVRQGQVPSLQFPDADARIIGAALRPLAKSSPQTSLTIAFALSFGLLTGLLAVAVAHALDRTLGTRAQVRHALGVQCLGQLPDARRLREMRAVRRWPALGRAVVAVPHSRFAQAVRSARTAMLLPFGGERGRAIGFVSWSHGEGRTTVASNVAQLMAVSGNPVALIDGDLRRPTLTGQLAPRSAGGLSEALADHADLSTLQALDLSPSLSFLPAVGAGRRSEPNVYLGAPEMVQLLSRLTDGRDVVVDLPPFSTSSDAQALCPFLDGVVLVVEAGRTRVDQALDALRILRAADANVLGVVLNKARLDTARRPRPARR